MSLFLPLAHTFTFKVICSCFCVYSKCLLNTVCLITNNPIWKVYHLRKARPTTRQTRKARSISKEAIGDLLYQFRGEVTRAWTFIVAVGRGRIKRFKTQQRKIKYNLMTNGIWERKERNKSRIILKFWGRTTERIITGKKRSWGMEINHSIQREFEMAEKNP